MLLSLVTPLYVIMSYVYLTHQKICLNFKCFHILVYIMLESITGIRIPEFFLKAKMLRPLSTRKISTLPLFYVIIFLSDLNLENFLTTFCQILNSYCTEGLLKSKEFLASDFTEM